MAKTYKHTCECADKGCPVHSGTPICANRATTNLVRVDMEDRTGTLFCEACSEDAMDSGLFTRSVKTWINATRK